MNYTKRQKSGDRIYNKEICGNILEPRDYILEVVHEPYHLMPTLDDIYRCELYLSGVPLKDCRYKRGNKDIRERMIPEYGFKQISVRKWVIDKDTAFNVLSKKFPNIIDEYPKGIYQLIYKIKFDNA